MSQADHDEVPEQSIPPALPGLLEEWTAPKRSRRWLSDTQRYRQLGNAVCVPVITELTAAASTTSETNQVPAEGDDQVEALRQALPWDS